VCQFEVFLQGLKTGVVLGEKTGSFARRPVRVRAISSTAQLFTDEVFGISTVSES